MDGMGEEKFYFHPFNSVKSQKAPFGQIVATNFVTDCNLSAFYRPLAWQNKIMGSSFLAIYAASFHAPCLISASKEAWPRALETVGGIFPLQRWRDWGEMIYNFLPSFWLRKEFFPELSAHTTIWRSQSSSQPLGPVSSNASRPHATAKETTWNLAV